MSKEGPQKAQCPDNQLALGHLSQLAFRAQQQGNYIFRSAIIKAARSIADCPFPIVTVQDALSLNGVGKSLASDIVKWVGSKPTGLDSANEPAELPGKGGAQLEDTSSDSSQGKVQRHKRARYAIYRPERGKVNNHTQLHSFFYMKLIIDTTTYSRAPGYFFMRFICSMERRTNSK